MMRTAFSFSIAAVASLVLALGFTSVAQAATEKVLYNFSGGKDGYGPQSALIFDAAGNLYGTTFGGGPGLFGTVFKLSPNSDGTWSETVLYSFDYGADGAGPEGSLVFDHAGNLYGMTSNAGGLCLCGTVFKLSPNSDGTWSETTIHSFGATGDGWAPYGNLIFDSAGNLYGVTGYGGANDAGVIFELTPNSDGSWSETLLYTFSTPYGAAATGGLLMDSAGNLYGTTSQGAAHGTGNAYELSPSGSGWTINVLHNFGGSQGDGGIPQGGLVFDAAGNLYGATDVGGAAKCGCGTIFRLKRSGTGWGERIAHNFSGQPSGYPNGPLLLDSANNAYGTTYYSENVVNGTVFRLNLTTGVYTVLHTFSGSDGSGPIGTVISDAAGNLYGTTFGGGSSGAGVVFEVTP